MIKQFSRISLIFLFCLRVYFISYINKAGILVYQGFHCSKRYNLKISFKGLILKGIKDTVRYKILTCNSRSNPIGRDINFSKVSLCGALSPSMSLRVRTRGDTLWCTIGNHHYVLLNYMYRQG